MSIERFDLDTRVYAVLKLGRVRIGRYRGTFGVQIWRVR